MTISSARKTLAKVTCREMSFGSAAPTTTVGYVDGIASLAAHSCLYCPSFPQLNSNSLPYLLSLLISRLCEKKCVVGKQKETQAEIDHGILEMAQAQ